MFTFEYSALYEEYRVYRHGSYICSFETEHEAREFCDFHNGD